MTYDKLRNAYLDSRRYLTVILKHSEKTGLEDPFISYLLGQEGNMGKNIYGLLGFIQRIKRGDKGTLITPKSIELFKSRATASLRILREHIEETEETIDLSNGDVDDEFKTSISSFHHSLNKIYDTLDEITLEKILNQSK